MELFEHKNFQRFTPFKVRKSLAEPVQIKSRNVVYGQLPQYMLKRLQRIQTCTAGYVFRRYATINLSEMVAHN